MRDMRFRISEALTKPDPNPSPIPIPIPIPNPNRNPNPHQALTKAGINDSSYARQTVAALAQKPHAGHQHHLGSIRLG